MILKDTATMGSFSEADFEQKLLYLKDTHDSISNLSSWCLNKHEHHAKIVSTWLNVLKGVKIEHRLILFYLANDVIQYSKRKSLPFVDAFAPALQKATTMVREDSIRNKILRLFKIWDERGIYDEGFLVDLSSLLSHGHKNANGIDVQDFQPSSMYSKIRSCKELEDDTDLKLKLLNENHISFTDVDKLRNLLKDRSHGDDVISDFDEGLKHVKAYIDALEAEIKERNSLIDLLEIGEQHYAKEFKEAKVVVNAYKCFATRVRGVKRKLEEQIETMASPIPSPDVNAPSPSPEPKDSGDSASATNDSERRHQNTNSKGENPPDSPYSPEAAKTQHKDIYVPPKTTIKTEPVRESSPKVYVPPKVQKHVYPDFIKEEYPKPSHDDVYFSSKNQKSKGKPVNFYSESSRESIYSSDKTPTNNIEPYYPQASNIGVYSHADKKQANYYKESDDNRSYSPKTPPPRVKQEYCPQPVPAVITSDLQQYYSKPISTDPYSSGERIPSLASSEKEVYSSSDKGLPTAPPKQTAAIRNFYSEYSRDDFSKSSNDDGLYSPDDKLIPENFIRDGSFSKSSFADSLKDYYSSKNAEDMSSGKSMVESLMSNGPSRLEGKSIEVVSSSPKEKMTLSALLQTLIPPETSTLHTIEPQSPDDINDKPPAPKFTSWPEQETVWETPESPPMYEKAAYPQVFDDHASQDVDMRRFDVDHRNLIPLTNTDSSDWGNDSDYRKLQNPPLPESSGPQTIDDVENVDMEMSDDEEKIVENIKNDPVDLLRISPNRRSDILNIPVQNSRTYSYTPNQRTADPEYDPQDASDGYKPAMPPEPVSAQPFGTPVTPKSAPYDIESIPYTPSPYKTIEQINVNKNHSFTAHQSPISSKNLLSGTNYPPPTGEHGFPGTKPPDVGGCMPPLFPPPPPPPPPPPQHPHVWAQSFPPPHFDQNQNFNQLPIYFNRPPPPSPGQPPPMSIPTRAFRGNFRPFHRGVQRFQRW